MVLFVLICVDIKLWLQVNLVPAAAAKQVVYMCSENLLSVARKEQAFWRVIESNSRFDVV